MDKQAVLHISEGVYAYGTDRDTLAVRLRLPAGDYGSVLVHYKNVYDHVNDFEATAMRPILSDGLCVMYEASLRLPGRRFKYYFEINADGREYLYTGEGFIDRVDSTCCFYYPVINTDDILALPAWAQGRTIYQIVVDRFCNGDTANDPPAVKDPHEPPDRQTFYGGDFQGITQKLGYIERLGVDMIYMCPVWQSPTYHKYDIVDYYHIEDHLGGRDGLAELVREAHRCGIRVILDAVFNHCSNENPIFQDVIRNGESSRYSKWFFIESYPVDPQKCNYDSFAGCVPQMPRFDTTNPEVIEYLTDAALYWTRELDIDGWRLDVADEVSHTFWREFRRKLKAHRSDLLIVGEAWYQAGRWMQGDEFDTFTNYRFRKYLLALASGRIGSVEFWHSLGAAYMPYKTPLFDFMVNLAGSHDTERCATHLGGSKASALALAAVLTMPGMPLIYYGDEIGMQGGEDPDCRRAMQWDDIDTDMLEQVTALVRLRSGSEALRRGSTEPLCVGDRALAFRRRLGADELTVVINFGHDSVTAPGAFREVLLGAGCIGAGGLTVKGMSYAISR